MPADTLLEPAKLDPSIEALTGLLNAFDEGGLVLLDRDGRIVVWNKGAERLEGYAAASMTGEGFARGFAAEERESQVWDRWRAEAARVGWAEGQARRVRRDGRTYWAGVRIKAVPEGFALVLRDESDADGRLRHWIDENRLLLAMQRTAPVDFWAVTADGEAAGRFPSRWLAGPRDASWYGEGAGIRGEDRAAVMAARQGALIQQRAYRVEYETTGRAESSRWLIEEGVPRLDDHGRLWGVCGYVQDVTRWRLESAAPQEFVRQLTQEVRASAASVLQTVEIAAESLPAEERMPLFGSINRAAQDLLARVNNVAELGRSGPKRPRRLVNFDPNALLRDVWETAGNQAADRGIVLEALIHDELPARVQGDATGLRQILRVLLGHAVQAAHQAAVLEVRCLPRVDGHALRLELRFAGVGLDQDLLDWLLSPAALTSNSAMTHGDLGVGLSLARRAADEAGGNLTIAVDGDETRFACELELLPAAGSSSRSLPSLPLTGRSVLAVTADRSLRKVLQLRFAALGMRAMTAETGEEAWGLLEAAPAGTFDLVLVEYKLPQMNGNTLARRLAGHPVWRDLPLVTVSMAGEPGQAAAAHESGFGAYLTPPLREDLMRDVLQALLAQQAAGQVGELITRFSIEELRSSDRGASADLAALGK